MAVLSDILAVHGAINDDINNMMNTVIDYSNQAISASKAYISTGKVDDVKYVKPTVAPFDVNQDFGDAYLGVYDELVGLVGPELDGLVESFMNKHFPKQLYDDTVAWLDDVIKNGYRGIPEDYYNQIWNRGRDRELRDVYRLEDEALSAMSGRGWSIPPGAIASRLYNIQQEANAKIASMSREIAIKDVDMKVDMVKFAIEQAVSMVNQLWGVIIQFLREHLSVHGLASAKANQYVDARRGLYSSMYQYYEAVARIDETANRVSLANQDKQVKLMGMDMDAYLKHVQINANCSQSIATAFGQLLQGMASSRNTLSTQGNFTTSTG